ncbi:FMN-binding protein [Demequina sp. SYSU T00039]|uniref:FMN-binding protein n=1 Tax=Demequina lignilytica TaxID=3051663 RepID=A0AAW7M8R1_9MICO|nr:MULTISPECIES: FMN-binding protein [unclassified Demequina]MDN4477214.1 FMN-binding protein [Demequina sp. SYSU T00039-1]MDN4487387.1 FMN-binding protein [Demequina sp. SYSU T00039]
MRASRAVIVAGGCVAIVGAGWAVSPKELPDLNLAEPDGAATADPTAEPTADPTADPTSTADGGDADAVVVDGPVVTNIRGDYQARITVVDGTVTAVEALAAGTQDAESVRINAAAVPELAARVLAAQTWDVDHVSGASFTSPGFLESVEGAFAGAGL